MVVWNAETDERYVFHNNHSAVFNLTTAIFMDRKTTSYLLNKSEREKVRERIKVGPLPGFGGLEVPSMGNWTVLPRRRRDGSWSLWEENQ